VDLNLLDRNISVKDWRAAWVWPTETRPSACLRIVSGFENGAISGGGGGGPDGAWWAAARPGGERERVVCSVDCRRPYR